MGLLNIFKPKEPVWKLDESTLALVRGIEEAAKDCFMHVALGGSVLHKGQSFKDLDIFVYHSWNEEVERRDIRHFIAAIRQVGVTDCYERDIELDVHYPIKRLLYSGTYQGKTIDFFFMNFPLDVY